MKKKIIVALMVIALITPVTPVYAEDANDVDDSLLLLDRPWDVDEFDRCIETPFYITFFNGSQDTLQCNSPYFHTANLGESKKYRSIIHKIIFDQPGDYEVIYNNAENGLNMGDNFTTIFHISNHTFVEYPGSEGSCIEKKTVINKCSICGCSVETELDEYGEHNYVWSVTKEPTIFEEGVNTGVCSLCNDTITSSIPKEEATVTVNDKIKLKVGKSKKLKVTTHPDDSIAKWESYNKKVATVNKNGKVKARKPGKSLIVVTTKSGAEGYCTVVVK